MRTVPSYPQQGQLTAWLSIADALGWGSVKGAKSVKCVHATEPPLVPDSPQPNRLFPPWSHSISVQRSDKMMAVPVSEHHCPTACFSPGWQALDDRQLIRIACGRRPRRERDESIALASGRAKLPLPGPNSSACGQDGKCIPALAFRWLANRRARARGTARPLHFQPPWA